VLVARLGGRHRSRGCTDEISVRAEIITSDAPGLTTERVEAFERTRPSGPLWPKDPTATYLP
jgi:hypothetical protein